MNPFPTDATLMQGIDSKWQPDCHTLCNAGCAYPETGPVTLYCAGKNPISRVGVT